jgi:acetyltransferase-like isoleucine patch superfamily enzyme
MTSRSSKVAVDSPRPRRRPYDVDRLRNNVRALRHGAHVRFALANALTLPLPKYTGGAVRVRLYRWAGFRISDGASIRGNLELTSATPGFYDKLVVGPGSIISPHVTINLDATVTVATNVVISPRVMIYTGSHRIGPGSRRMGVDAVLPVAIEDGAWVRLGAVIAPGVTIGRGSIVATGAVVLKDVPPNTYVEGNPATVIRRLPWGDR